MFCTPNCGTQVAQHPGNSCPEIITTPGGIGKLVFINCAESDFVNITDLTEWETKIAADDCHATGFMLANKPKGSVNEKKVASCLPPQVVGGDQQIDFSDYNSDPIAGSYTQYDFWNFILENRGKLAFGWTTCDDRFYGFIPEFSVDVGDVIEEDKNDNTFFQGNLKWLGATIQKPIYIPGLNATLA